MSADINKIVVFDKINYNEDGYRYFTGYQKGEIIKRLCISNEWVYKIL